MRARTCRGRIAAAIVGAGLGLIAAGSPALGAERAIELVNPAGADPRVWFGSGASTPDGNMVCFSAERALPGTASNGLITTTDGYCSHRSSSGWDTTLVTGPAPQETFANRGAQVYFLAPDGSRAVFASDVGLYPDYRGTIPGDPAPRYGTLSAFMWEAGKEGMPRWLAPAPEPLPEERFLHWSGFYYWAGSVTQREPLAVSDDLRYGLIYSSLRLVPADTNDTTDVYKYTPDGLRLVSHDANGAAAGGRPPLGTGDVGGQVTAQPGSISSDGSRVFFHHDGPLDGAGAADPVQNVFLSVDGEIRHISHRNGPGPADDVNFEGASADGTIAYLSSVEQLTDEPTQGGLALYRYDVASDDLRLVATHPGGVTLALDVSRDGSTLVYTAENLLYVLRGDVLHTLGTLGWTDMNSANGAVANPRYGSRALRVSEDGSQIVFHSGGSYDASPPDSGFMQAYRWTPSEGVRRISATDESAAPTGDTFIGNGSQPLGFPNVRTKRLANMRQFPNLGRVVADDGRVFFETTMSLVPDDHNTFLDVYEWQDGRLSLVTPGTQQADAYYHDNSADGNTVFFTTEAALIPQLDRNVASDLYAARVGGGFPLPPEPRRCAGDECQGETPRPPTSDRPASGDFQGPGDATDPPPAAEPRHRVLAISARQRRAFARRGRMVLQVRVTARGWVSATATARIRGRNVRVARSVRAGRSGRVVKLPLSLSRRARAVLRSGRSLRVTLTVEYSQSEDAIRRVVVLRG